MKTKNDKALVVLSGGQDSATCLSWAIDNFEEVQAITFEYGQRHVVEVESSIALSTIAKVKHHIVNLGGLFYAISDSALLNNENEIVVDSETGLPNTFVPMRNTIFLSIAGSVAYKLRIKNIVTGVCQTDYSGYPDCRDEFIRSLNTTLNLGTDSDFLIHTPLMFKTKAETCQMMQEMGRLDWYKYTHTCYKGKKPPCMECPACKLRAEGFKQANLIDPLTEV